LRLRVAVAPLRCRGPRARARAVGRGRRDAREHARHRPVDRAGRVPGPRPRTCGPLTGPPPPSTTRPSPTRTPAPHRGPRKEPSVATAPPADQLRLLDVQELDTRAQQLAHQRKNLPEHARIAELD